MKILIFKLLKLGIIGTLLLWAGSVFWQKSSSTTSRAGTINAPIINVYSPIDGYFKYERRLEPGTLLEYGEVLGEIENKRNPGLSVDRQTIKTQIQSIEAQEILLNEQIGIRERERDGYKVEATKQQTLRSNRVGQDTKIAEERLQKALKREEKAKIEEQRYLFLYEEGAMERRLWEQKRVEREIASKDVEIVKNELERAKVDERAANEGLQLEGSMVSSHQAIRRQALDLEIQDLRKRIGELGALRKAKVAELSNISEQIEIVNYEKILSPISGAIWSLIRRYTPNKSSIEAGAEILQIVDCEGIWIEAFLDERNLSIVSEREKVKIRLLSLDLDEYYGTIRSIRAGSGRLKAGEDVAIAPDELVKKEIVAIIEPEKALIDILNDRDVMFCGVGLNAEVIFSEGQNLIDFFENVQDSN